MDQIQSERGHLKPRRIGFVSTRFNGTDGVSLETRKWAQVLEGLGHACFYFSGESDQPPERSRIVPRAHFQHPDIEAIQQVAFTARERPPQLTAQIHALAAELKNALYQFCQAFEIELLIVENALTIPLNVPLGIALTELLAETSMPAIAHHHDFFWERQRFMVGCVWDYIDMAFPPHLPSLRHVVINSTAGEQLGFRNHTFSLLIPNVMDFDRPPPPPDAYSADLKQALGVREDEFLLLQPTRIIPRKAIEHAVELTGRLGLPATLVISHASGDEGDEYAQRVREYAALLNVRVVFASSRIASERGATPAGEKIYSLRDIYQRADLTTYPSTIEGFGNAFLEALYFRRPIVVNNYSVYNVDIKPKGFQVVEFDGFITRAVVDQARALLENPARGQAMAETNYALATKHYSYTMLARRLETLLAEAFGE
ncbi:MAG: Mannosylglucosylglycerate synthase [Anaerolineae bacterium]|nr:Mannosylglucosylglycerate synthase [Anaerolineae bacterium]